MATSIKSQGTTITFFDGATAQTVGGVESFNGFDGESTEIPKTTLASTAKEFDIGLEDFGAFNMELSVYDGSDAGQSAIMDAKTAAATREIVLTLSSGDIATFDVVIKSFSKAGAVDDIIKGTISTKITGAVAWT